MTLARTAVRAGGAAVVAALVIASVDRVLAQAPNRAAARAETETLPVQGQVHLIAGAGGNVTALVGPEGVMLVDAGREDATDRLLAAVRALTPLPIHFVINTNADSDHIGGNAAVAKAGRPAPGSNQAAFKEAPIYAHENALRRLSASNGPTPPLPVTFWPTVTFFTEKRTLFFNSEPIELLWQKAAHTDGDLFVFFRRSDVLSVGDVMSTETFPVVDLSRGGSIQGVIDALNRIIDITIPRMNEMDGTRVIPGHGRICNEADVVEYRDMVTIIRDRVAVLVEQGKTLEQVQAARPAYEYEPLYSPDGAAWTTRMFVEAVYRSLAPGRQPARN
jgi:glyoxylase-like metal-dependent hydrolase (beta-lactamase superfamily II)